MGNAAPKAAKGEAEPPPLPELIRQSSKSKQEECSICLEQQRKGILCSTKEHFICQDCFAPYVTSVVEDAGKMQDAGFTIKCCYPNCTAEPWTSHEARLALDGHQKVLDHYVDALIRQLQRVNQQDALPTGDMAEENVDTGLRKIVDALTLGCPFCHVALDPTPDGCAAMRCGSCSKYFCFLCFNIQRNNTDCHAHVRECPSNPSHNLFPSKQIRDTAQKQLRIAAVCDVLSSAYGLHWRQHAHTKVLLEGSKVVLKDSFITPGEVLGGRGGGGDNSVFPPEVRNAGTYVGTFAGGFLLAACIAVLWMKFQSSPETVGGGSGGGGLQHEETLLIKSDETVSDSGSYSLIYSLFSLCVNGFFSFFCMAVLITIHPLCLMSEHTQGFLVIFGTIFGYFQSFPILQIYQMYHYLFTSAAVAVDIQHATSIRTLSMQNIMSWFIYISMMLINCGVSFVIIKILVTRNEFRNVPSHVKGWVIIIVTLIGCWVPLVQVLLQVLFFVILSVVVLWYNDLLPKKRNAV